MGRRATRVMDAMESGAGRAGSSLLTGFVDRRRAIALGVAVLTLCLAGIAAAMLAGVTDHRREARETVRILTEDGVRADLPVVRLDVEKDGRAPRTDVVLRLPVGGEVAFDSERIPRPVGVGALVAVLYSPSHPGVAAPVAEVTGRTWIRSDTQLIVALRVALAAAVVPLVVAVAMWRRPSLQK